MRIVELSLKARSLKMHDTPLFTMYHRHDPATSRTAAVVFRKSGKRRTHAAIILEAVQAHPGNTAHDLEKYTPLTYVQIDRRALEMERDRLIHRKGVRNGAMCWWPGSWGTHEGTQGMASVTQGTYAHRRYP